ncbi:MAG: sulfur carrier protein ThiS [Candidatus Krumholzibacteriota bacterium]|nr:sulfur carrier protein ThiS [Candidatus Krumholzibacteriota bacterium]
MIIVNNRDKLEWKKGMTVQNVLDEMRYNYSLITVTVDGKLVPAEEYDSYTLEDNSDVNVFHLAHGG